MCLTLNSAVAWAGSMSQVVVVVCGIARVLISCPFWRFGHYDRYRCVMTIVVATNILSKTNLSRFGSSRDEQVLQSPKFCAAQVAKLFAVYLLDRFVESGQKLQPMRGDSSHNHAPVLRLATTRDQFSLFQAVEQPCDVRI